MADGSTRFGNEQPVDPRLFQANERTLLAWVRTGLGLLAFGFVLERVDGWLCASAPAGVTGKHAVGTAWIGEGFVILGLLANALAILRFVRFRRALRMGAPFPIDVFPIAFAVGLTILAAALAIYVVAKLA
jgi:putative membrane protein